MFVGYQRLDGVVFPRSQRQLAPSSLSTFKRIGLVTLEHQRDLWFGEPDREVEANTI